MASECDLAWAAGLFEGEGCITFERRDARATVRMNMVDPEPLRRFAKIVGLGKVYGPYRQGGNRSPYFAWYVRRDDAFHVLESLRPWLSQRRLARWAEVAALAETARPEGPSGWARQRAAAGTV